MTLITRLSRLFRADVHALLDLIEEPDVLIRQAIREMEDEVSCNIQRVKALKHERHALEVRQTELEQSLVDIEDQLDTCFQSAGDDLARTLIKRQLETRQFRSFISRKRDSLALSCSNLEKGLHEQQARLQSMQQKAELLAEQDNSPHGEYNWKQAVFPVQKEDVEVAFLREKQARQQS